MSKIVILLAALALFQCASARLQCLQCPNVLEGCEASKATPVPCSGESPACTRQVKQGSSEPLVAIRKCVLPEVRTKTIPCPSGYDCTNCDSDLCNSATWATTRFGHLGVFAVVALAVLAPRAWMA